MNDELDLRSSDPELATPSELGDVVADLKLVFLVPPDELTTRRHLAALATPRLVEGAETPRARRSRRRRRVLIPIGVTGGLILATSGLAAAGELPTPVQHAVAAVAAPFGFDLPTGGSNQPDGSDGVDVTPAGPGPSGVPGADSSTTSPPTDQAPSESAPGQGGENPGNSDQAPGHGGTNPGNSDQAPGHGGTNPGNSDQAPGHGGTNPGNSDQAPGHGGTNPGNSDQAPGHGGTNPGKSGETHGPSSTDL